MSILAKGRLLEKKLLKYKQEFARFVEGREREKWQSNNILIWM